MNRKFRTTTSSLLLICVLSLNTVSALLAKNKTTLHDFKLSPEFGSVTDTHAADNDIIVFQIKDLHASPDVQRNIARIIEAITSQFDPSAILVEGYWGVYDVSPVQEHPADPSTKRTLVEYFSQKGQIAGSEYFAFTADSAPEMFGIEDYPTYASNRDALQTVLKNNKLVLSYVSLLKMAVDQRMVESLNPRLQDFYRTYASFVWEKNLDIASFADTVSLHLGHIDLSENYRYSIEQLLEIVALEGKINHMQLQSELRRFFVVVKQQYGDDEQVKNLSASFMKYFVGAVSNKDFFTRCGEFVAGREIDISQYPQIKVQLELQQAQESLRTNELLNALHDASRKIIESLALDEQAVKLCGYADYLEMVRHLVTLNLTNTEWAWLTGDHGDLSLDVIHATLDQAGNSIVSKPSPDVLACIDTALQFYRLSSQRDGILYEKTKRFIEEKDITCCIQITGGFHTDAILASLREDAISYVAITPNTGHQASTQNYTALMGGYKPYVERLLGLGEFQTNNLAPELVGVQLITSALDQLAGISVSDRFAQTLYNHMSSMSELEFEAGGTILDLFKSSTPLSPQVIDDFIAGKLTAEQKGEILELVLMSGASPYFDVRYLQKLKKHGFLEVSDEALEEFGTTMQALKQLDRKNRKQFIERIRTSMSGKQTVEPQPMTRTFDKVDEVVDSLEGRSIVYFSPEMKLLGGVRSLFWGGLGVLAGEYVEGLADTGIPTYGVTLLYRKVVRQRLTDDGVQVTEELPVDYRKLPVFDTGVMVNVNAVGVPVRARVWEIPAGDARVFALEDMTSDVTGMLYGGANETPQLRAQQDQLLGRGGIEALQQLLDKEVIKNPPAILHMNEANCIFVADEVIQRQMFANDLDPNGYWNDVGLAFTTHTPVPAGLPKVVSTNFSTDNVMHLGWLLGLDAFTLMRVYSQYAFGMSWQDLSSEQKNELVDMMNKDVDTLISEFNGFIQASNIVLNLTEAAATLADITSSVSLRHEQVTNSEIIDVTKSPSRHEQGQLVQSIGITNGVNLHDWQPVEFQNVAPDQIPDETLIAVKRREKEEFLNMVNTRAGSNLSADHLTISVMRRTNTYKRTDLILQDIDALAEQLKDEFGNQHINIVFSGISHPKDEPGKAMFKNIQDAVKRKHPNIHVVFVEQYDISVAKYGVRGSDIWLMMPVEKMEASSTSHQKALGAGTIVVSSFDGAMIEEVVDIDVDAEHANGAFITPLILNRTVPAANLQFIDANELEPGSGFYSRPTVSILGGAAYSPVAVIARGDVYIIIDEIVSDISPQNLMRLNENPPIHLQESDFDISVAINGDGTISQKGINNLMYKSLDPFTTQELMNLYLQNRQPWYNLLYQKVSSIAQVYYGAQRGDFNARQQYVNMLRNAVGRTYEVDIRRMALEYIQYMYSGILAENAHRAQTGTSLLEQIIPEDFLLQKIKSRRAEIMEAKQNEFEYKIGERLSWGYMGDAKTGTQFESVQTVTAVNETTHLTGTPMTISVDIAFGLVVQPEDFEVELYLSQPGRPVEPVVMQQDRVIDPITKKYRYSVTLTPDQAGDYQFSVALRPVNENLVKFMNFVRMNKGLNVFDESRQQDIDKINALMDTSVDLAFMKWSQPSAVSVIAPVTPRPSIAGIEQAAQRELLESSL